MPRPTQRLEKTPEAALRPGEHVGVITVHVSGAEYRDSDTDCAEFFAKSCGQSFQRAFWRLHRHSGEGGA